MSAPRLRHWRRCGRLIVAVVAGAALLMAGCGSVPTDVLRAPGRSPLQLSSDPLPSGCPWLAPGLTVAARVDEVMAVISPTQLMDLLELDDPIRDEGIYEGHTPALPGLCIPRITEQDGSYGVASGYSDRPRVKTSLTGATQLPAPIADAAAWDPALARSDGRVIGSEEARAGVDVVLAPTVNIARSSRWGRSNESLGEDPELSATLGVSLVKGIQSQGVVSVVKHFAVYNQEAHRTTRLDDSIVSSRALHEIYLPAFSAVVRDAHPGGVMCALNLINGTPACEDQPLLDTILRDSWGFAGFVRTDCGGILTTVAAVDAEVSQVKCNGDYRPAALMEAMQAGQITLAELDGLVRPLLAVLFQDGLIAAPEHRSTQRISTAADRAVAEQVDDEGAVLLRNQGALLPLHLSRLRSLALIGARGATPVPAAGGASYVRPTGSISALQSLSSVLGSRLRYNDGSSPQAAAATARGASVAVVVIGYKEREGADLATLDLPAADDALVRAVEKANPHTIVVLETGGAVVMPWLDKTPALLETWYPGQMAGPSLLDLLSGRADPSGKLPVTFPTSETAEPAATQATFGGVDGRTSYAEGIDAGYRWYEVHHVPPAFSFGYGLSYAQFLMSGLHVLGDVDTGLTVTATISNLGPVAGADVVQCYVGDPTSTGEPPRQLRGFARVSLRAGTSAIVVMHLPPGDLATWDDASNQWVVTAGSYAIDVGDGSALAQLPLRTSVDIAGADLGADSGLEPVGAQVLGG